ELTVLGAGLATVAAFLLRARLYPGKAERLIVAGVTNDVFALVVRKPDRSRARAAARGGSQRRPGGGGVRGLLVVGALLVGASGCRARASQRAREYVP